MGPTLLIRAGLFFRLLISGRCTEITGPFALSLSIACHGLCIVVGFLLGWPNFGCRQCYEVFELLGGGCVVLCRWYGWVEDGY